jgi:hypothetical protein
MPLVLPGETGVGAGDLFMPNNENELAKQGCGSDKGKAKRLERSESFD